MEYHNPVLLQEAINGLNIIPNGVYVDATFGGGGHSKEILRRLEPQGKLFAFDQDADALKNSIDDTRFILINENFKYIKRYLRFYGYKKVDGILADLGVSSYQFNVPERGFSTRFDATLDMRMCQKNDLNANKIINQYSQSALEKIFFNFGELNNAAEISKTIIEARVMKPITNTNQLKVVLKPFLPFHKEHKIMAQIFQAIRIEVNQEIEVLKQLLLQSLEILNPKGRLSVISYHSLEDRLVKRFIKNGMFDTEPIKDFFGNISLPLKAIGKLIIPNENEIKNNNRARSAKLRVAEKVD